MRLFEGTPFDRPPRCERCGQLETECACPPAEEATVSPEKQTARLSVERRAKGKTVTVVRGLVHDASLPALLTKLKSACGAGGTLNEDDLEIQGNQLERVRDLLKQFGYKTKG